MAEKVQMPVRRALLQQVAPRYQQASALQKRTILDGFVCTTGYARKYAQWLLKHAEKVLQTTAASYRRYGPEVHHALLLAWKTLNQMCSKRLIPFLPDIIGSLEQYGHVQLGEEHRLQLFSISTAMADRILGAYRQSRPCGVSTTQAGPLLKQQIPIRTFAQWDETLPGFLEADLVAHCGGRLQGGCLYTLTLTDVATGWNERLYLVGVNCICFVWWVSQGEGVCSDTSFVASHCFNLK